jgi:hypothetical protein
VPPQSYVLHRERNVLVSKTLTGGGPAAPAPGGASLQRAGTRKAPAAPLLTVPPPVASLVEPPATYAFEPGSLLSGRKP